MCQLILGHDIDFRLSTFDFRLSTFDFRLSTFDFRLSTFKGLFLFEIKIKGGAGKPSLLGGSIYYFV